MNIFLVFRRCLICNLLVPESSSEYSCSVPLYIIISVDNYTLRKGNKI